MELLELGLRWIVAPMVAVVWMMYRQQQAHITQLAVLQNQADIVRTAHDREIRDIKDMLNKILEKLDDKADK
jgi:hypothetical protein